MILTNSFRIIFVTLKVFQVSSVTLAKVINHSVVSFFCEPMNCPWNFQSRTLEWGVSLSPGDLPNPNLSLLQADSYR